MNVVICGAGEVGRYAAEVLGTGWNRITVIDLDPDKLAMIDEAMDVRTLAGNGSHADLLLEAGCAKADLFIAATHIDEINLLSASIAKAVGASRCVARVHHAAFFEKRGLDYGRHLGIDHLVCPEYATAQEIVATLRSPGALAIERFAQGRIEVQQLRVSPEARAAGTLLRELRMPRGARLCAVEHEGRTSMPDASTRIEAGDIVTVVGEMQEFEKTRELFDTHSSQRRKVMIMGGSALGVWLCRAMRHKHFSIRLFEPDAARAQELAAKLDWVTVLRADVIHSDILMDERVDRADAFIGATEDDEQNILAAARAKSMGVAMVIAALQRPTYLHLLSHVGIDRAFSPRATAVGEIQRLMERGPVRTLASLSDDVIEAYEMVVPAHASQWIGHPLAAMKFPKGCLVAAIERKPDRVFVPGADDVIEAADHLILIGPAGMARELTRLFHRSNGQ